jgi:hypothetical protein
MDSPHRGGVHPPHAREEDSSTDPSSDEGGDLPDEPEVLPDVPDAPPAPEGEAEPE